DRRDTDAADAVRNYERLIRGAGEVVITGHDVTSLSTIRRHRGERLPGSQHSRKQHWRDQQNRSAPPTKTKVIPAAWQSQANFICCCCKHDAPLFRNLGRCLRRLAARGAYRLGWARVWAGLPSWVVCERGAALVRGRDRRGVRA